MFLWHDVMANPSPGHLQEGAHPGLLGNPSMCWEWHKHPCGWLCPSLLPGESKLQKAHLGFNRCQENKAKSTLARLPPLDPHLWEGRRGGKAAKTSHSQQANINHFFVKSFSTCRRRTCLADLLPGGGSLVSFSFKQNNIQTQWRLKLLEKKMSYVIHGKALTASVKYMKFW